MELLFFFGRAIEVAFISGSSHAGPSKVKWEIQCILMHKIYYKIEKHHNP